MAVYLDSSALVKLVLNEAESVPLALFLAAAGPVTSSSLAAVEVLRVAARSRPDLVTQADVIISRIEIIPFGPDVIRMAASVVPAALRTLDAIHVASAVSLGDALEVLVTYDRRMAEAASTMGIPVASPA